MTDPYPVTPFQFPVSSEITLPGSKSITNRALIIAALADGHTRLENCLFSEDTEIMVEALKALGFKIQANPTEKSIEVEGLGGRIPNKSATIHVGNSGTSARFLTAFCCLTSDGEYTLDGVEQMRKRPIKDLVDTLVHLGAEIETNNGFFPITIRPHGLNGGHATIDAMSSSQFVSALIMAAPYAKSELTIELTNPKLRRSYIDMTLEMLVQFGIDRAQLTSDASTYTIRPQGSYKGKPGGYLIEGDASAASYFFALPLAVGGQIEIHGVTKDSLQGDTEFTTQVEKAGATIEWKERSAICRYDGSAPKALNASFYAFSDTFLTAAALAPLLDGTTTIDGISHTRHQECDRIAAMADGLNRIGQNVDEQEGSLTITPQALTPAEIETYHDHRVAMSFGILACVDANKDGQAWLKIKDPTCCKKTFPNFFQELERIRQESQAKA